MINLRNTRFTKILSLILALIFIVGAFSGCGDKEEEPTTTAAPTTTEPTTAAPVYRNPLTGEKGYDPALLNNRPVLVSVENHPDARPQWGLTSSDIVWEMVAEGGITRMLLMYADASRLPEKIGPTRSARHYFVDLAEGFDAIFVHFGYSPAAKSQIANHDVDNINGLVDGSYFKRDTSRNVATEHRAYTTDELIAKAIADKGYRTEIKDDYKSPFKFNEEAVTLPDGVCNEITVSFSSSYTYKLTYDAERKVYLTTMKGNKFVDSEGTQQNFENVVCLYTNISSMGDKKGRVTFDFSDGEGVFVSNGTYQNITWKKGNSADMLKLYDAEGNELKLNPGRTYIAICDDSRESTNKIVGTTQATQ